MKTQNPCEAAENKLGEIMERMQLKAKIRDEFGKGAARKLRREGLIPGIIYGRGFDPLPLTVDPHDLDKALIEAGGTNLLFDLEIEGKDKYPVMVREYQADVIDRHLLHVDFLKVDLTKKINVEIPVRLEGKAPGVKEGGILEHLRRTLEVVCLPTKIPGAIGVDVSQLKIGDTFHVHDLKLPEGVELVSTIDVTIAAVVAPVEEKVEEVAAEEAPTEPELVGEKKPAEGEAEEAKKEEKK